MNTPDGNLNLNTADCLRSASDFGVTHVHNICTGAVTDVPWGSLDWVAAFAVATIIIFVLGIFTMLGRMLWRDGF